MTQVQRIHVSIQQWIGWTLLTITLVPVIGYPLLLGGLLLFWDVLENSARDDGIFVVPLLALSISAVCSFTQYYFLRRFVQNLSQWVGISSILAIFGIFISLAVFLLLRQPQEPAFGLIIGASTGASIGFGQWLMLRSRLRYAGLWIPITMVGWWFLFAIADIIAS